MGEQRVHKGRAVEKYVMAHPDSVIMIDDVAAAIGWRAGSVSTTMGRMVRLFPENMERIRRGVYRWNSAPIAQETEESTCLPVVNDQMSVTIVAGDSDVMLVKDNDGGKLYKLTPFNL